MIMYFADKLLVHCFLRTKSFCLLLSFALGIVMLSSLSFSASYALSREIPQAFSSFDFWLEDIKAKARARGISPATVEAALGGVVPLSRVIELDRRQPEFMLSFWQYLDNHVTPKRIERGRRMLEKHKHLLKTIQERFGVPPRFLVAFWAIETNFGDYTGTFDLMSSLATLAYDDRRSAFFEEQLFAALDIMERGDLLPKTKSSWAGAMGQLQFIPTTYRAYAIDFDRDGKRDLWNSYPDIFGSAANYLHHMGWVEGKTWGREVRLPDDFDLELAGVGKSKRVSLLSWQKRGIRRIDGQNLPNVDIEASLVMPAGYQGPKFLVYRNYHTTLAWNRSTLYAIAVGHLADRLQGGGPLQTPRIEDTPLSRKNIIRLQKALAERGFDPGKPDGIPGARTRNAIKNAQKKYNFPPDGYPTFGLLERIENK